MMLEYQRKADACRLTLDLLREQDHTENAPIIDAAVAVDQARVKRRYTKKKDQKKAAMQARRQATAELLAQFDRKTPHRPDGNLGRLGIGMAIRHGYLKKKGDGYVRTAKAFVQ